MAISGITPRVALAVGVGTAMTVGAGAITRWGTSKERGDNPGGAAAMFFGAWPLAGGALFGIPSIHEAVRGAGMSSGAAKGAIGAYVGALALGAVVGWKLAD